MKQTPSTPPPIPNLASRLPLPVQAALLLAIVYGAYALLWRDWAAFSLAIDQRRWLFNDFRFHFYPMAEEIFQTARPTDGFFYSAFFAVALRPFAFLSIDSAAHVWGALQVASFAALCLIPLLRLTRLSRKGLLLYLLLCATSYPALSNFKWGQVSVLLTLLTLGAFDAQLRRRSLLAGALIALAASIKYYSGFFMLFFLFRRDWRACLSCLVSAFVFFVFVPIVFLGPNDWWQFHREAMSALADSSWVAGDSNSQFFAHVLLRWQNGFSGTPGTVSPFLILPGAGIALLNLFFVWKLRRSSSPAASGIALALLFCSLPFLVSTSWPHYFVYLPFAQVMAILSIRRVVPAQSFARKAWMAPVGASIIFSSLPFFLLFPSWAAYQEKGFLLLANVLLLPPLYAACLLVKSGMWEKGDEGPEEGTRKEPPAPVRREIAG